MSEAITKKKRPVFLDVTQVRMPVPAFVSILHRISGVLLFLLVPFALCAARAALSTEADFAQLQATLQSLPARLVILLGGWALLHHACAGIRFLLLDIHVGVELAQARRSSVVVLVASLVLTAALAVRLW